MQLQRNKYTQVPAGIVVVNKPENQTSAQLVATVKKILEAKKVGHTGTLDPFATGIVICCINQATKLAQFFLEGDKTYEGVLHLGIDTDTQDKTGQILSQNDPKCENQDIISAFKRFKGEIEQTPPVFSALKHKGIPLYQWARKGQPVQKSPRKIHIYELNVQDISLPFVRFDVRCSSGTYVRTLCADIGRHLGCGGHLKDLCRIESSGYTIDEALTYEQISAKVSSDNLSSCIIPLSESLKTIPKIVVSKGIIKQVKNGNSLFRSNFSPEILNQGNVLQLITPEKRMIAVVRWMPEKDECKVVRIF
jgi:tRNA pseudouridine55 synthase